MRYFLFLFLFSKSFAADLQELHESDIVKKAKFNNFNIQGIQAALLHSKRDLEKNRLEYGVQFNASASDTNTNRLSAFGPATISVPSSRNIDLNFSKKTYWGTKVSVGTASSLSMFDSGDQSFSSLYLNLEMSLLQNLLGHLDDAKLDAVLQNNKLNELQSEVEKLALVQNVRMIFWAIVANNQYIDVNEKLIQTSRDQLELLKRMSRRSAAENSDVLQAAATLAERLSNLEKARLEKINLENSLRQFVPSIDLNKQSISVSDLDESVAMAESCFSSPMSLEQTRKLSSYTKINELILLSKESNLKAVQAKELTDLKLVVSLEGNGNADDTSESVRNSYNFDQRTNTIGLLLTIPIGSEENQFIQRERAIIENDHSRKISELSNSIENTLRTTTKLEKNLSATIALSKEAEKNYRQAYGAHRQKFEKGRINYLDLLNYENVYVASQLSVIESKYNYIKNTLEYLSVFDQSSCAFNQLAKM